MSSGWFDYTEPSLTTSSQGGYNQDYITSYGLVLTSYCTRNVYPEKLGID